MSGWAGAFPRHRHQRKQYDSHSFGMMPGQHQTQTKHKDFIIVGAVFGGRVSSWTAVFKIYCGSVSGMVMATPVSPNSEQNGFQFRGILLWLSTTQPQKGHNGRTRYNGHGVDATDKLRTEWT